MECKVRTAIAKSRLHQNNEDCCFIGEDYIIIADGMGGECDGDVASRTAVEAIKATLSSGLFLANSDDAIIKLSSTAIHNADSKILEYIDLNPGSDGMGTTVLLVIERKGKLYISWCGDSHCYVFSRGSLRSMTKDHSYVQELIDAGQITEQESFTHPDNNLITRYVGGGAESCVPEFVCYDMSESDMIVMCSDGLSGYCRLQEIENLIKSCRNSEHLPSGLLELAVSHGSDDDITIAVMSNDVARQRSSNALRCWFRRVIRH